MIPPAQRSATESASAPGHRRWCPGPPARASGTPARAPLHGANRHDRILRPSQHLRSACNAAPMLC
jgi:hypothetical protein